MKINAVTIALTRNRLFCGLVALKDKVAEGKTRFSDSEIYGIKGYDLIKMGFLAKAGTSLAHTPVWQITGAGLKAIEDEKSIGRIVGAKVVREMQEQIRRLRKRVKLYQQLMTG